MQKLAEDASRIKGVVAVTLIGSQARGDASPDSADWDFIFHYSEPFNIDAVHLLVNPNIILAKIP